MRVELDTPAAVTPVMADEEALRRALSNLVGNAIKYAASGGWLGIGLRRVEDEAPAIRIEVADHGPGITSEDAAQVFEPFYRGRHAVDQQIHGNGLGLSLVARIAEAHGGTVSVSETPGGGATFTLQFPAVDVPAHD
jgi:signal transduction histidine kinase